MYCIVKPMEKEKKERQKPMVVELYSCVDYCESAINWPIGIVVVVIN